MRERLCGIIINHRPLREYARHLDRSNVDDIIQQVALVLCEQTDTNIERIEPYIIPWSFRVAHHVARKMQQKRARIELVAELGDIEQETETPIELPDLSTLYWYDRELILLKEKLGSNRAVATAIGIPPSAVDNDMKRIRHELRVRIDL
jgi:DNA-directed RNA polymerase specialized sigma24 family protein